MSRALKPTGQQAVDEAISRVQNRDLLSIPAPTKIEKLRTAIPPAINVLPTNALPAWSSYPLEKKFPNVPANPGTFAYARNAIGNTVFPVIPNQKFDNEDPYMKATPRGYTQLHDVHLRDYFEKHPKVFERLVKEGLVDPEDGAVHTDMKQFNDYRAYLGRLRNSLLATDLQTQDNLTSAQIDQLRKIKQHDLRQVNHARQEKKDKFLDALRKERDAKELYRQLHDSGRQISNIGACERTRALTEQALRREQVRQKVRAKLAKLRRAERRRARRIILEWYCRQLYADMVRKARTEHKKKLKKADLESFINAKREFQEVRGKYLKNLREKKDAERECHVNKRRAHYENIEAHRIENLKKRELEAQLKAQRELYLMRKFGMRWLNFVRQQKNNAKTYHDSVWHVRQQLLGLVKDLKKESGRVSFTNFIQGLVSLKPGREPLPKMSEETKDVINYILDLLIDSAFDTYKKQHQPCAEAYENQARRRKILGKPDLTKEDFMPPPDHLREKPNIPYERPAFPCDHFCRNMSPRYAHDGVGIICLDDEEEEMLHEADQMADEEVKRLLGKGATPRALEGKGLGKSGDSDSSGVAEELSRTAISRSVADLRKGDKEPPGQLVAVKRSKKKLDRGSEDEEESGEKKKKAGRKGPGDGKDGGGPSVSEATGEGTSVKEVKKKKGPAPPPPPESDSSVVAEDVAKIAIAKSLEKIVEESKKPGEEGADGGGEATEDDGSSAAAENLVAKSLTNVIKGVEGEPEGDGAVEKPEEVGDEGVGGGSEGDEIRSEGSSAVAERLVAKSLTNVIGEKPKDEGPEDDGSRDGVGPEDAGREDEEAAVSEDTDKRGGEDEKVPSDRDEDRGDMPGDLADLLRDDKDKPTKEESPCGSSSESSVSSDTAMRLVNAALAGASDKLKCKDSGSESCGDSSDELGSAASRIVNESIEKAKGKVCGEEDDEESCSGSSGVAGRLVQESIERAKGKVCGEDDGKGSLGASRRGSGTGAGSSGAAGKKGGGSSTDECESVSSVEAEGLVAASIKRAVESVKCLEDDGSGGSATGRDGGVSGSGALDRGADSRGGTTGDGAADTMSRGGRGDGGAGERLAQGDCESIIEEMAAAVVKTVIPPGPVDSTFFHDLPTSRTREETFPLSPETLRTLPPDLRDNVLRTLSNVQDQLDAVRRELQAYGVIPPEPPSNPN